MAVVAEFISVLRKIRDVIYPEINELYDNSLELKELIDVGKIELDESLGQFNIDYQDFNAKKDEVDAQVLSATNSATSAGSSATTATNKSNEIKAITAQSVTGAPGTGVSASYNPTDGKFTFVIPQGSKGDKGESFTVNSSGVTESRALYDGQITGWSFLDVTTSLLYFKISSTSGDWSTGVPFGKGDTGVTGDTGVGIVSFTFIETTDLSGLPSKSGATDTYRVTLTNNSTFDYQVYNGLDFDDASVVHKTGDEIINDIKTFTSSPIVPTPTTGTQAVNKDYVDSSSALPIGTILNGYTIFDNCIVAFGGEFNRADYPKLWAYLQANSTLVKTQAEWTTENTTNGMCGFFSDGNGTTTFRVPNLDEAFLRPDSRTAGSFQEDSFKSHSHGIGYTPGVGGSNTGTGPFAGSNPYIQSEIVGGTETRPKNIAVLPLIVAK